MDARAHAGADDLAGPREIDDPPHYHAPPAIHKLHRDILLCVLDFLPLQYDRFHMLLVCKSWNENLRSTIWGSITIGFWYQLKTIVQRINENRDLGRLVRELRIAFIPSRICGDDSDDFDHFDDSNHPGREVTSIADTDSGESEFDIEPVAGEEECSAIGESVLYRNIPWPHIDVLEMCKAAVHNSDVHSWLLILVLLLPNMRIFEVSHRLVWEDMQDLFDIFACFSGPGGPFTNSAGVFLKLEEFRITRPYRSFTSWSIYFSGACFPILHLPALRVLHLDLAAFNVEEGGRWTGSPFFPAPDSLPIQELHLRTATPGRCGVIDFIRACKRLVFFSWQCSGFDSELWLHERDSWASRPITGLDNLSHNPVHEGLLLHSESLETLRYNDRDLYGAPEHIADPSFWFGPMSEFTALRVLRIRFQHLTHPICPLSRLLPPLLQELTITGTVPSDVEDLVQTLLRILGVSAAVVPQLRVLTVEYIFIYEDEDEELASGHLFSECALSGCFACLTSLFEPVKDLCERSGIQWHWMHQQITLDL